MSPARPALGPLSSTFRSHVRHGAPLLAALAILVGSACRKSNAPRPTASAAPRTEPFGGYVGAERCRGCHASQHKSWFESYHRTMTQFPSPAAVRAPWSGVLPLDHGRLELARRGDEFWVTQVREQGGQATRTSLRVELLTGSHHMQLYWVNRGDGNRMALVPYTYLIQPGRWAPVKDTFLADPAIEWHFGDWNSGCLQCHATAGQPRPDGKAFDTRVAALGISCEACHGPGERHVGEMEKAKALGRKPDPHALAIVNPERLSPRLSTEVCGQCHAMFLNKEREHFLKEGFSYRPGEELVRTKGLVVPGSPGADAYIQKAQASDLHYFENRFWPDGTVRVTGREMTALLRTRCHLQGGMTCLSCHSPHEYREADDQLNVTRDGDEACASCHQPIAARLEAHTHHAGSSPGSRCMNCHMPHTTYGLLKQIRSHEIESPRAARAQAAGRPTACNLCHLDQSLGWAAGWLERWYGQQPPPLTDEERSTSMAVELVLRGDAAQRALVAWHLGWGPARQAAGDEWMAGPLTLALTDSYAAVRFIAAEALRTLPGFSTLVYEYAAPPDALERSVGPIIATWARTRRPLAAEKAARLFLRPDGSLDTKRVAAEVERRDEHPLEISE